MTLPVKLLCIPKVVEEGNKTTSVFDRGCMVVEEGKESISVLDSGCENVDVEAVVDMLSVAAIDVLAKGGLTVVIAMSGEVRTD